MNRICRLICGTLYLATPITLFTGICSAQGSAEDWKSECVGRMKISFPGEVEVAAATQKDLKKYADPPTSSFVDLQPAPWSDIGFLGGIRVIHGMPQTEIDAFMAHRKAVRDKFRADAAKTHRPGKDSNVFKDLPVTPQNGLGFQAQGQKFLVLKLGSRVFTWSGYTGITQEQAQRDYDVIIAGLHSRELYTLPTSAGVCLPYAFIRDSGQERRYVATTYRLRAHPDITILLKDVNAIEMDSKRSPKTSSPEYESDFFWTNYQPLDRKSLRSVWVQPYKKISLANSKGVESFVKIVRNDETLDYGYLVVARGDPDAKEDTPDLMLYVLQDSKNAKAKGVTPLGKESFLEVAQAIAASVQSRPVLP